MPVTLKHNRELCNRIKVIRTESGLTQKEFAKKVRSTEGQIKHIEGKRHLPNFQLIRSIHKTFKVSYDYIFDGVKTL